jgi:ABC-type cobalamin/Fe3+-siderophores transport system ATPase subunit
LCLLAENGHGKSTLVDGLRVLVVRRRRPLSL